MTEGLCEGDKELSRVPLFEPLGGLVPLAPRTFVTGGNRNLVRDDLPNPITIFRGRSILP